MYNRYIPQPDGSYQRNRMADPAVHRQETSQKAPSPAPCSPPPPQRPPQHRPPFINDGITGFLRQLLPKDLDTGDLFIVLLLLLMAGDKEEDRNTALLTLALYFLM